MPRLRAKGWQITFDEDYPYQVIDEPVDDWYASIDEGSALDWFDVELGIMVKGEKINLLPLLQQRLQQLNNHDPWEKTENESILLPLPDGRFISLPTERVKHIVNVLLELYDRDSLNENNTLRCAFPRI